MTEVSLDCGGNQGRHRFFCNGLNAYDAKHGSLPKQACFQVRVI